MNEINSSEWCLAKTCYLHLSCAVSIFVDYGSGYSSAIIIASKLDGPCNTKAQRYEGCWDSLSHSQIAYTPQQRLMLRYIVFRLFLTKRSS